MEVQLQAALITASAVVLGLVVQALLALRTLRQRRRSDDREALWSRIQWAVDHTLASDAAAQEIGAVALYRLLEEDQLEDHDRVVVVQALAEVEARQEDVVDALLARLEAEGGDGRPAGPGDGQEGGSA